MAVLSVVGSDGALVEVDGELLGEVPWEGEVEGGEHSIRLSGEGYLTYDTELDMAPAERTELTVDLTRGRRPRWLAAVEWGLLGLGAGMLVPGIAVVGTSWSRYQDSEALYGEIDAGRFADRRELDLMWSRYDQIYQEYRDGWTAGWAVTGIGIVLTVASAIILILDRGVGVFSGRPEAEIEISPLDEGQAGVDRSGAVDVVDDDEEDVDYDD
jgi:hypothetical protein